MDPSGGHPIAQSQSIMAPESDGESDIEDDLDLLECYPKGAPSLLDSKYLAAQGSRIVVGATRKTGLSAEKAFEVESHTSDNNL